MVNSVLVEDSVLVLHGKLYLQGDFFFVKLYRLSQKISPNLIYILLRSIIFFFKIDLLNTYSFLVSDSLLGSASEDEEDDDNSTASSVLKHHPLHGSLPSAPGETNNNSLSHSDIGSSIGQVCFKQNTKRILHNSKSFSSLRFYTELDKCLDHLKYF